MSTNKQLAKNTLYLYTRQFITMLVSLYTVRIVLQVLGAEDYGIYNVVGGVVSSLSFLSGTMAISTQRYFSFALGNKNGSCNIFNIFRVTFLIYLTIMIIVFIVAESLGLWFVNTHLVIPEDRMYAVNIIYQTSILSFLLSLFSSPFMACIIAHENMNIFAQISIIEVILKLIIVFLLQLIHFDKLIIYACLLLFCSICTTTLYVKYAFKKYSECCLSVLWDKKLFKEMTSYSIWNLFGNIAWILKNQGISILLNMSYGPIMNAAHALSIQIRNIASTFAQNFSMALNPQIIKNYAAKNYDNMFSLLYRGCKITFFLMMIIVIPLFFHIDYLLHLWLENIAPHTISFTKLMLFEILIESISLPMASANQATGKIKKYQSWIGFLGILNLPLAFFSVKLGFLPEAIFIISIILQSGIVCVRLIFLNRIKKIHFKEILTVLLVPTLTVAVISYIICYFIPHDEQSFSQASLYIVCNVIICLLTVFIFGLNKIEKNSIINLIKKKINYDNH